MNIVLPRKYAYARRMKHSSATNLRQRRLIIFFFVLSALISVLLPIYFAILTLHGLIWGL